MTPRLYLSQRRHTAGAGIIIVLAFVILLAACVVAYLSRTSNDRQVAHGDFNDSKSDQLARSALDIIVSDFKQEIVNGSNVTTIGNSTVYIPTNAAYML